MTQFNKILLKDFRNFKNFNLDFNNNLNILYGINGSGKTNILESLSLFSKGRGFKNASFNELIKNKKNNFFLNSEIEIELSKFDVKVFTQNNLNKWRKKISVNDDIHKESIDFLYNSFSLLFFLPEMERLFVSSPFYRRNFIDKLIFSYNKFYNKLVNKYKKNLTERSRVLQENSFDLNWINRVENNITEAGLKIYNLRKTQLKILNENLFLINKSNNFPFELKLEIEDPFYNEDLNFENYMKNLVKFREYDKKKGGAKFGPHKSDIIAKINGDISASLMSTGQQKTIVLMILIAQCNYLVCYKSIKPILLLDEICSHLDSINRKILLDMINCYNIQFFFTGTDKDSFSFISTNATFYNITQS